MLLLMLAALSLQGAMMQTSCSKGDGIGSVDAAGEMRQKKCNLEFQVDSSTTT
jgi:hypothetical protein